MKTFGFVLDEQLVGEVRRVVTERQIRGERMNLSRAVREALADWLRRQHRKGRGTQS